jgi:hypothetical protein
MEINVSQNTNNNSQQIAFRSGELVPVSGIWRPFHESCQGVPELWIQKALPFPPCPACGSSTDFTLLEQVEHISEDSDFR